MEKIYDGIVIGGGHAGVEAALQARATCSFYDALRPDSDTIRKELFSRRLLACAR